MAKAALETAYNDEPKQSERTSAKKPTGPNDIYLGQGKFVKVPPTIVTN